MKRPGGQQRRQQEAGVVRGGAPATALRAAIRELHLRRSSGDLNEKSFQRRLVDKTLDLYRAVVAGHLAEGGEAEQAAAGSAVPASERFLAEHHVVHGHLRLSQSVLREPEQEAVSLFATDCRLLELRSLLAPDRPSTCDERDETTIRALPYAGIRLLRPCREVRKGEILAGLLICGGALLLHPLLQVTGTLMVVLGALGVAHGLLLPTSWVEIEAAPGAVRRLAGRSAVTAERDDTPLQESALPQDSGPPMRVFGLRRKSARILIATVGRQMRAADHQTAGASLADATGQVAAAG
jgi:hypothetical protein